MMNYIIRLINIIYVLAIIAVVFIITYYSTMGNIMQTSNKADLYTLASEKRYLELDDVLNKTQNDNLKITIYKAFLANYQNNQPLCIKMLEPLVKPEQLKKLTDRDTIICLKTLADAYSKQYRYADAANSLSLLIQNKKITLPASDKQKIQDDLDCASSLKGAPVQTVSFLGPFKIPTSQNEIGLTVVKAAANNIEESWIIDTGASTSLVSSSEAVRLNLKVSKQTIRVGGADGSQVNAHTAIIPILRLGSACIYNTPTVVVDDKDLYIPSIKFQLKQIIGYPVLSCIGSLTISKDNSLSFAQSSNLNSDDGARMFIDDEAKIMIALSDPKGNQLCMFDSGAPYTTLFEPYWKLHKDKFNSLKTVDVPYSGMGGSRTIPAYIPDSTALTFGKTSVKLGRLPVLTKPHTDKPEVYSGNLGQDVIKSCKCCTFDFRLMRFYITKD